MSDISANVDRLVEIARRLRAAADELGQVEIKSRIVDEISELQEIRDALRGSDSKSEVAQTEVQDESESSSVEVLADGGIGIVEPTGKEETYSLTPEDEDDSEPVGTVDDPAQTSNAESDAGSVNASVNTEDKVAEQRAIIEMRIADLEQLEQAATRRLNDVPTPEQKQIKAKALKAGRESGRTGKELQQYANGAMHLSPEQRSEIQAARKDVLSLREAIAKERAALDELENSDS